MRKSVGGNNCSADVAVGTNTDSSLILYDFLNLTLTAITQKKQISQTTYVQNGRSSRARSVSDIIISKNAEKATYNSKCNNYVINGWEEQNGQTAVCYINKKTLNYCGKKGGQFHGFLSHHVFSHSMCEK